LFKRYGYSYFALLQFELVDDIKNGLDDCLANPIPDSFKYFNKFGDEIANFVQGPGQPTANPGDDFLYRSDDG
jgi:hypothetical protein